MTSTVVNILESIIILCIHTELLSFLTDSNNKSCLTNLLETLEKWTSAVDYGYDYSKAFDSVTHCKLVSKFKGCGIHDDLLQRLSKFLTN